MTALLEYFVALLVIVTTAYVVLAGGAYWLVWVRCRTVTNRFKIQRRSPTREERIFELKLSLLTATVFSAVAAATIELSLRGYLRMYRFADGRGWAYFAFSVLALLVAQDTWFYWTHRWMHHRWFFRAVHAAHHRSRTPSPWSAYAFSGWESLTHALILPMMAVVMPFSLPAMAIFFAAMLARNVYLHLGYEITPLALMKSPLTSWNTTTLHHDLHHQDSRYNFGLYFTLWDAWLGTLHPDRLPTRAHQPEREPERSR